MTVLSRRGFLAGIIAASCAPAIVRAASLMPIKLFESDAEKLRREMMDIWRQLKNDHDRQVAQMLRDAFADGTQGSQWAGRGLAALIADTPQNGEVGGIERAESLWWRNREIVATYVPDFTRPEAGELFSCRNSSPIIAFPRNAKGTRGLVLKPSAPMSKDMLLRSAAPSSRSLPK